MLTGMKNPIKVTLLATLTLADGATYYQVKSFTGSL
jgi:hypothetical protein